MGLSVPYLAAATLSASSSRSANSSVSGVSPCATVTARTGAEGSPTAGAAPERATTEETQTANRTDRRRWGRTGFPSVGVVQQRIDDENDRCARVRLSRTIEFPPCPS